MKLPLGRYVESMRFEATGNRNGKPVRSLMYAGSRQYAEYEYCRLEDLKLREIKYAELEPAIREWDAMMRRTGDKTSVQEIAAWKAKWGSVGIFAGNEILDATSPRSKILRFLSRHLPAFTASDEGRFYEGVP
jgi:hypothetical protein